MVIMILAKEKIKVVSSIKYNPELTLTKGNYTKFKPNKEDHFFIKKGIKLLGKINSYNHVQGLVIKNSKIIARETSKGTKKMLQLIKKSNKLNAILIKFPKKKQDLRIDLPTIGLDTLRDCNKAGIKGVVLKSKKNIFMNETKSSDYANKHRMFITVK